MLAKLGLQEEKKDGFFGGLSGGGSKGDSMLGGSSSSGPQSLIPQFTEEPACAKCCPKLTYQQRLIGFVGCAGLGWVLSFVGSLILIGGFSPANIQAFAALYVIGNVCRLLLRPYVIIHTNFWCRSLHFALQGFFLVQSLNALRCGTRLGDSLQLFILLCLLSSSQSLCRSKISF